MAFDSSDAKAVWAYGLGTTPKRCELQLFLAGRNSTSRTALESFPSRTLKYEVSAGLPDSQKITALLIFLPENLEKYRSTELYNAPLQGSTVFLYRSSTSRTPLDSSRLAKFRYGFFSKTGPKTKKLRRSNLFQLTIFKHGLLQGSTIYFNTAP